MARRFTTVQTITKEQVDAESLERPVLVDLPDGRWRLYLSCATYGTKHWRVEVLEADDPGSFDPAARWTVLPGDDAKAVKDPVIMRRDGTWHLWASTHPLADADEADQMVTEYATSPDGLDWTWHGVALERRPGEWDSRGVRVSSVRFAAGGVMAFYDGRATAAENYEERTGLAVGTGPAALAAIGVGAGRPVGRGRPGPALRQHCRPGRRPRAALLRADQGRRLPRPAHRAALAVLTGASRSRGPGRGPGQELGPGQKR